MKHGPPFEGSFPGTAEEYVIRHAHWYEKLAVAVIFGWAACGPIACATAPKKTSGFEVLSMCGGYYTGKALESPKASVAIDEVDHFLNECRQAAPDNVCSHYACLLTQSTEAKIQRDLDAQEKTSAPDGTILRRRPRQLSQDPLNLTRIHFTPDLHWEVLLVFDNEPYQFL